MATQVPSATSTTSAPPSAHTSKANGADQPPLPANAYCQTCGQVLPPLQVQEFPKMLYREKPKPKDKPEAPAPGTSGTLTLTGLALGHDVKVQVKPDDPEPPYETVIVETEEEEKKKEGEGFSKDVPKPKDAKDSGKSGTDAHNAKPNGEHEAMKHPVKEPEHSKK